MGKNELEAKQWFAIRVTYSREMALKEYLDRCRMESFIPMSYKEVIKGERKVRKLVPVIHNLVFVRSTREKLDEIKRDISLKVPIRYIMDRETRRPLVVPDRQMHSFIAVAGAYDEQIVYLDPTIVSLCGRAIGCVSSEEYFRGSRVFSFALRAIAVSSYR